MIHQLAQHFHVHLGSAGWGSTVAAAIMVLVLGFDGRELAEVAR